MIILDLSQILYSTVLAGIRDITQIDEDFIRHITLNCIRSNFHKFKKEHIIKGDVSDGIPNILSSDSIFAIGGRQGRMTQPRFDMFMNMEPEEYDELPKRNYFRNEELIDLTCIPFKLTQKILKET